MVFKVILTHEIGWVPMQVAMKPYGCMEARAFDYLRPVLLNHGVGAKVVGAACYRAMVEMTTEEKDNVTYLLHVCLCVYAE